MTQNSTIELWLVDLKKCAKPLETIERAVPRLAADDLERADAISDPRERRDRLAAYTALRILLERLAGSGVRGRPFVRTSGGKPRLDIGTAEFSLSHIDGLALIGVSSTHPLGVDLERVRPIKMAARRLVEISAIGAGLCDKPLPALGTERAFLQAWARLEAFTKARGRGLAQTLADVGVRGRGQRRLSPADLEARARRVAHDAAITVHDVSLSPSLHGAVGAPHGLRPMRCRAFPTDHAGIERVLLDQM
jgi:4'-phosphopantetheinyl transferase